MQEKARREANKKKNAIKVSNDEIKEEKAQEEKTQKQETQKQETKKFKIQHPKKEAAKIRKQKQRKAEKERKKEREKRIKQEAETRRTNNVKMADFKEGAEVPLNKLPYLPYNNIKKVAQYSGSDTWWVKNNARAVKSNGK